MKGTIVTKNVNLHYRVSVLICFACLLEGVYAGENTGSRSGLVLSNKHVRFEFEPVGMGLAKMVDLRTKHNHIQEVQGKHLLWEVALGVGRQIYTITNNYQACSRAFVKELPNGIQRAVMEWKDLRWWNEDEVVTVRITVELPADDGVALWRISVENRSDYWGLWSVLFPIVNGFPASGQYDIAKQEFARGGVLSRKHADKIVGKYPGATWSMQLMSFNRNNDAVYLASMDSQARAKDFVAEPIKNLSGERYPIVFEGRRHKQYVPEPGERTYIIHYPDNMGVQGSDYPDYYPVAFGVYQGAWLDAAHRYRPWALKQKWVRKGPLSQRTDVPEKIKNIGIWIRDNWEWNGIEGSAHEMNQPLLEAAQQLQVPVGLQWYRWHQNPFDNNYPHFIPAKDKFKERTKELVDNNIVVMPYINGSSADMNITDFHRFAPHAVYDEAGGIRHHYYSNQAGRLLSMCGQSSFWQDTISSLVDDIFSLYGVNGIYVDQVAGLYHELCFARNHGHPLGGGSYWADGNRDLLGRIKGVARKDRRDCVVTSEGASEVFFDVLDGNLLWSQPSEKEIPMLQVVYSGYTLFFGSPCDYQKSDRFFVFAQGRAWLNGRQNGWMDLGLFQPEYSAKAAYLKKCGQYRVATRKFLTLGRLWGPIEATNHVPSFQLGDLGWGMYEAIRTAKVPGAEARLWQSEDGHLGIFLANYVDEEVPYAYALDPEKYGLHAERYHLTHITPDGPRSLGTASAVIERREILGPQVLKVIEISPAN